MAFSLLARALLVASVLPHASLVGAQTVTQNGELIPADETTVAPAAQVLADPSSVLSDAEKYQLTDAVLANLTELELTNISLFNFAGSDEAAGSKRSLLKRCKTYPGDFLWPSKTIWKIFNILTGGALIETVPIGAVCYKNNVHYNAAKCADILAHWTESATHAGDPTSVMSPLYQGETCMPQSGNTSTCEIGGFPSYSVKATTVSQIQLAVNFARNLNLRLVVHNTGHDFLGKSTGAGALSIWTHNLKSINFIKSYSSPSYRGPAFKLGAGIQVLDLYEAAKKYGVTAVGGECKGVGVTGGYIAGGGHSPISSKYGMGADQVLSIDVVTPSGRFITADENNNKDLFWAIRGGGGGTFGVVTSMTVKVHPKMHFSGVTFTILSGANTNVTDGLFFAALEAYWRKFPSYAAQGTYAYSTIFPLGAEGGYMWSMLPWLVPEMSLVDFKAMVTPLFDEWTALGLQFEPEFFEHDNFYDTWTSHFPVETVANINMRTASRLFPIKNWEDEATLNKTISTIRAVIEDGSAFIQYNINGAAPAGTPDNAVNPAWRDATLYGIFGGGWAADASLEDQAFANNRITNDWGARFREITPGSGGYLNEGDVMEPDFGQAFFGSNYDRLVRIKKATDPWNVFWAPTAVGSEDWYITGQEDWLTLQTGHSIDLAVVTAMKLTTGVALAFLAASTTASPTWPTWPPFGGKPKHHKGVPYAEGSKFMLDGKPFLFAGSNAYWLPFINQAKHAGLKVMRTWAFNDKNATYIPGGLPMYGGEGAGESPIYFQSFKDGVATINYGPDGLQALDKVVKIAEETGIKLVMALTNNWADYGGMDVYTVNLGGKYHDDFFHSPKIVSAFKKYTAAVVSRYKDSPAIFAWELANEPRCGADGKRNLPRSAGTNCSHVMVTDWIADIGKFIKGIDKKHMVTWGGEGEFYEEGNEDWAYAGADGGHFYNELALEEMDFGTFHLYPDWWDKTAEWANKWVTDHGKAQVKLNKPVLFEEYGWLHPEDRLAFVNRTVPANQTRVAVIGEWQKISLEYKMSDAYWQLGVCGLSIGCNHNDGFTIYLNDTEESRPLIFQHAKEVAKVNRRL
ncbi:hypothetical protein ACLOAV_010640 [Pseudogymnoascus australis]